MLGIVRTVRFGRVMHAIDSPFEEGTQMTVAIQPFTGTFVVDPVHSSILFTIAHMKIARFSASFHDFDGHLVADQQGVRLEGAVRVESISITKPPEFRESVVNGADFFDAQNYPKITVRLDDVEFGINGTLVASGELTIKGIAKPVNATGSYQPVIEDPFGLSRVGIEFSTTVDRRDWGMKWQAPLPKGGDVLGYEVELTAHVELIKQN
jgi:polyisoprenoid-binding protein YceI